MKRKKGEYRKDFLAERAWLLKNGLTDEQVEQFYVGAAWAVLRDDDVYAEHNLPMYGLNNGDKDSDNNQSDIFAHQRGRRRRETEAEQEDETGWCSIQICTVTLSYEDKHDVYDMSVSITEQLGDDSLVNAITGLSERRQTIVELLVKGWPKNKIARYLGISGAAVSNNVAVIMEALTPCCRKLHYLK